MIKSVSEKHYPINKKKKKIPPKKHKPEPLSQEEYFEKSIKMQDNISLDQPHKPTSSCQLCQFFKQN